MISSSLPAMVCSLLISQAGPVAATGGSEDLRTTSTHRFVPAAGTVGSLIGPVSRDPTSGDAPVLVIGDDLQTELDPGIYVLDLTGDVYRDGDLLRTGLESSKPSDSSMPWNRLPGNSLEVGTVLSVVRDAADGRMTGGIQGFSNGAGCGGSASMGITIEGTGLSMYAATSTLGGISGPFGFDVKLLPGMTYTASGEASSSSWCERLGTREEGSDALRGCGWAFGSFAMSGFGADGVTPVSCHDTFSFDDCHPGSGFFSCTATGGPAVTYLNDPPTSLWTLF